MHGTGEVSPGSLTTTSTANASWQASFALSANVSAGNQEPVIVCNHQQSNHILSFSQAIAE